MIKYVKAKYTGKGFITHEDQKKLVFSIQCQKDGDAYVKVEGESADIKNWKDRVDASDTTEQAVQTVIDSLPKNFEEQAIDKLDEIIGYVKG